jgi:purine-binding chemotaxis protein CheW
VTPLHLLVRVGDERYALRVHEVVEVARFDELTPVPGSPRAVMGVHNLRGQVVPVIDLGSVLGMPRSDERRGIVIVEDSGGPAGLAVDALLDVDSVDADPQEAPDGPLLGSAIVDGTLVGILDVPAALRLARGPA